MKKLRQLEQLEQSVLRERTLKEREQCSQPFNHYERLYHDIMADIENQRKWRDDHPEMVLEGLKSEVARLERKIARKNKQIE